MKTLLILFMMANSPEGMTSLSYERQFTSSEACTEALKILLINRRVVGSHGGDLKWRIVTTAKCVAP